MELLNRYTDRNFLHFTSITIITFCVVSLILTLLTPDKEKTIFGTDKGFDYSALYIAGKILNEYGSNKLYDYKVQHELYHSLRPYLPVDVALPNPYPPHYNAIFMPLARLPFAYSYIAWLIISGILYISGISLMIKKIPNLEKLDRLTIFLLAISFEPFIIECWIGGQTSSFGFFFIALSIYLYDSEKSFLSGLSLAMCLYKPPLLILILPFLILNKRYKVFLGFLFGGVLIFISIYISFGGGILLDWFKFAFGFLDTATGEIETSRSYKFVDLVSFIRLLSGGVNKPQQILLFAIFLTWLFYIIFYVKLHKSFDLYNRKLSEASIITWSTIINIYFPIYDTIFIVISLLIYAGTIFRSDRNLNKIINRQTKLIVVVIYLVPWITGLFAKKYGLQLFTIALIGLAVYIDYKLVRHRELNI